MQKLDIYPDRANCYTLEIERLNQCQITLRNKELISEFHNYLFADGSGAVRVTKLSTQLRKIGLIIKKDFDKLTKKELQTLIAEINRESLYKEATKADYRRCIKQFYIFLIKTYRESFNPEFVELVKEIKGSYKRDNINFSNIIKDEDIDFVIEKGCKSIKEKALLKFLHESGARVGELLNMKIQDIEIRDNCAMIRLYGKTGERRIPIVNSLPYLIQYLTIHPYKRNTQSYFWLSSCSRRLNKPLLHNGCQKLINACFKRSEMQEKKHNLHWFRHSRATLLAPHLTEVLLCKFMGWVLGSKQVRTYVHLCTGQLENAYLSLKGLEESKEKNEEKPARCGCGTINSKNSRYCYRCGKPLSVEIVIQDQELVNSEINKTMQFFMEMAKNPELMKRFENFKAKYEEK